MSRVRRPAAFPLVPALALAVASVALALPLAAIPLQTTPAAVWDSLGEDTAQDALWLSLRTTSAALALIVVVGTPAAWLLATRRFRGRALVVTLLELPLVLPPAVAGIALLAAVGPSGLAPAGLELDTASVVVALTFVAAPFYLRSAIAGFAGVDRSVLDASRTLGAGEARTFAAIAVPAAMPSLVSGGALALGRALGEFGATLIFAGSFQGVSQTVPLAIYERFATDFDAALALSVVLLAISAALLLAVKLAGGAEALGGPAR